MSYSALKLESQPPDTAAFQRARGQARREKLWARLRGQSADLRCFQQAVDRPRASGDRVLHRKEVPLQAIVGSVGRCGDYSQSFLPLKDSDQQRWTRVKEAFARDEPLPPIQLAEDGGGEYFVIDGHHRVSVARQLGFSHLEAQVLQALPS